MTDYSDIPEASALRQEREIVTGAISHLDAGGSLTSMTIAPPPPAEGAMATPQLPVGVSIPPPTPENVVATIRGWLVQRQADLDAQLEALGVTNPPEPTV